MSQQQQQSVVSPETVEMLRQAVVEADEVHRRVHHSQQQQQQQQISSCTKRRQESSRLAAKVADLLADFERSASFSGQRRFANSKFFADAKLSTAVADLNKPSDSSNPEPLVRLQKAVQRLAAVHAHAVKQQQNSNTNGNKDNNSQHQDSPVSQTSEFYATHRFLNERAPELVGKALELHKTACGLQGDAWASIPDSLLVLLDDVITAVNSHAVLLESEESRKRLVFTVEELSHQQGEAIGEGDMKAAEELYFKKVAVEEGMVPLFDQMSALLDEHHLAVVMHPAERAQQVLSRASSELSALAASHETRKKQLDADLKALLALQKQLADEDRELRSRFVRLRGDSDAFLKENLAETDRCYRAMEELERHVARLAAERSDAIARRLVADVQEAQRVADLDNFFAFAKEQRLLLETSLRSADASEEVTDLFHELVSSGCNAVGQRVRALEADIEAARLRLHEERLAQFRNLYLTLGDLQYKKERNLEELDKKIEQVHIQQEIAMDTFNPKAKDLANAKKELLAVREEMTSQIGVINGKAQLQIEYFKPTEQALVDAGKQFLHPAEELAQKNEQRQQKLLEYHQLMSGRDNDPAAELGGAPVEDEMQQLEELRQRVTSSRYKNSPNKSSSSSARMGSASSSSARAPPPPAAALGRGENSPTATAGLD